ncbi:MAG: peptidoglycan-binding protein, partial [Clostridia bacterium]|nr:peptidoglycan-binding protein [Clostridia bacterium]
MKKRYIRIACIALSVIACIIPVMTSSAQIAWGSTGSDVSKVQQKLKQWGYYDGSIDGIFGRQTYDAVVWFQKSNGLTADGKVGTQTAQALGITLSSSSKSSTSAEEYLLARAI